MSIVSQRARARYSLDLLVLRPRLQEIHHRVDFSVKTIPSERRHHGQRIAAFVGNDGDEIRAIGVLCFDVDQLRPDRAGQVAALDDMAGQAFALPRSKARLRPSFRGLPARCQ
jgi:hypothetical protein